MCQRGQGVVQRLFETFDDKGLRGFIVWLPMLRADNAETANARAALVQDQRVVKGWDARRAIGDLFASMLGLSCPAWDVYLLYPPGVPWHGDQPPRPSFWMHQLPEAVGADPTRLLDAEGLAGEVRRLLAAR